jgi:hypothetical protein
MTNHYHLLVETVDGNLSTGMRQLNGIYTQKFNRRHKQVGHLFQGRYKAILVEKEAHLLELSRYIVLNPVRAGMVIAPDDWEWSSYRTSIKNESPPAWLNTHWILGQFSEERNRACHAYQQFVMQGVGQDSPLSATRHQLFLGGDNFIEQHQSNSKTEALAELTATHRRALVLTLSEYQANYDRNEAMGRAYRTGAYTMAQIADHFGVHYMTVSRAVRSFEVG